MFAYRAGTMPAYELRFTDRPDRLLELLKPVLVAQSSSLPVFVAPTAAAPLAFGLARRPPPQLLSNP